MQIANLFIKIKNNRAFQTLLKIALALLISLTLTVLCVVFTPSIFNSTLHKGLELLPKNKFVEYQVQTKAELAEKWSEPADALKDDEAFFDTLRSQLPNSKNKDTFFAHMFVVHEYPAPCFFTIFGKHRTMDVTWTVQGIRCKGPKQCNDPEFIKQCPPRKRHN